MKVITTLFNFNNPVSGRNYDKNSVNKAVADYINQHNAEDKPMVGELDHPESSQNGISLSQISHKIKTISNDDGNITIEAELLDTPMGKVVQQMVNTGTSVSMYPRMFGHNEDIVDEEGNLIRTETIVDEIISWDICYVN